MLLTTTPLIDLLLALVCFYLGMRCLRSGHDLLGIGYLMTGTAAFTGFFDLGGMHSFSWIHDFLSTVARLTGTLAMGLGVVAILGGWRGQRYAGYALAIFGPPVTYYFYDIYTGPLQGLCLAAGCVFIVAVLALSARLALSGRVRYAAAGILGILLTVYVGLFLHSVPHDLYLRPVDIMHISLMLSYTAIYYSASAYARAAGQD